MSHLDILSKPTAENPVSLLLNDSVEMNMSTPKPEGYIARAAIHAIIDEFVQQGRPVENITLNEIHAEVQRRYSVDEKINTISSYKSQYKRQKRLQLSQQVSSREGSSTDIYSLIRLSRDIEKALMQVQSRWSVDQRQFQEVARAVLDDLKEKNA